MPSIQNYLINKYAPWVTQNGLIIDPDKPATLGCCLVLGCYRPNADASEFGGCKSCFCEEHKAVKS